MTLSIRKIGNQAFKDCNSLEYIYYDGSVDDWDNIDISDNNESLQNSDIEFAKEYTDTDESYDDEEDYDSNDYADENYNDEDYNDDEYNDDEYNDDDYDDNDYNDEDYENYDDNDNYDYNYNEPSYWAVTEVNNAIKNGLVTESVAYDYHAYITREQFCEMVVLAYESLSGKTASAGSAWFRDTTNKEILKAANLGIVNGYETGHFKPNELITREQIAAMVVRMLGVSVKGVNIHNYSQHYFTDRYEISDWALPSVNFAYENGIMNGVGNNTIAPKRNTTCEEAVLLINRTYEKYKNYKADATDKPVDKTNMTEKELLDSFLLLNTDGLSDYLYFLPDDYDGDGKLEAFIITGNKLDDYNCNNVTVWFVANSGGCSAVERNLYGYLSDAVKADSDKFIVWEKNAGGSGSKSYIFGCYNDDAYQPEISGKYGDFYKDENGVYTAFSDSFSNGYHDYVTHTFDYDFANHEFTENTNN